MHFSLVVRCCTISSSVSGATYFNKSPRRHSKGVLTRMFSVVLPSSFAGFPFVFRCLVRHETRFTAACFPFEVFVGIQRSTSCSFDLVFSRTGSVLATARRPPFFVHRGCLPRPPRTSQLQHPFLSPHFTVWGDPSTSPMDGPPPYKYSREEGWRRGETSRVAVKPSPGMDNCTRPSFAQPSKGLPDRSRDSRPKEERHRHKGAIAFAKFDGIPRLATCLLCERLTDACVVAKVGSDVQRSLMASSWLMANGELLHAYPLQPTRVAVPTFISWKVIRIILEF